jgi:hypothetical protein
MNQSRRYFPDRSEEDGNYGLFRTQATASDELSDAAIRIAFATATIDAPTVRLSEEG